MASHFSDIGFVVGTADDLSAFAHALPPDTPAFETAAGHYLRWSPGGGAELWFQVAERRLIGVNPHFDATTPTRVRLAGREPDPAHPLDGAFHLWLDPLPIDPADGGAMDGAAPALVDLPDYRTHDALALPADVEIAIAGFAQTLTVYPDEVAYHAVSPAFAVESLIPSGLFHVGGAAKVPPRAEAILSGTVEAAAVRANPTSGREFLWARVRTYGARLEIVADPSLTSIPPGVGSIVSGTFWLSGRILSRAEPAGSPTR